MYYFLPRKSIFACISTYIHSKIFPCEGSNPARGLKYPNVIPHFFKNFFGIWIAKKPDISGFFLHVILLVMLIWLRRLDLNQRPSGYEPDELPSCSTPRYVVCHMTILLYHSGSSMSTLINIFFYFNLCVILRHASICIIQWRENGIWISPRISFPHQ